MPAQLDAASPEQQRVNVIRRIHELCRIAMTDPAQFDNDPLTMTIEIYVAVLLRGRAALLPAETKQAMRDVIGEMVEGESEVNDGTD